MVQLEVGPRGLLDFQYNIGLDFCFGILLTVKICMLSDASEKDRVSPYPSHVAFAEAAKPSQYSLRDDVKPRFYFPSLLLLRTCQQHVCD